jgi:hypothetical protein
LNSYELINDINLKYINYFPVDILRDYRLLPLKKEGNILILLTDTQPSLPLIDDLEVYSNSSIKIEIIEKDLLTNLLNEYLESSRDTVEGMLNENQ